VLLLLHTVALALLVTMCCGAVSACSDSVCADQAQFSAAVAACQAQFTYTSAGIVDWDVSKVNNMYNLFGRATNFNGNLASWDVGGVTSMVRRRRDRRIRV